MKTGIAWDEATGDYRIVVCGEAVGHRATVADALLLLDEAVARHQRHLESMAWHARRQSEQMQRAA